MDRKSVDNGKFSHVSGSTTRRRLPIERVYIYNKIFSSFTLSFRYTLIPSFLPSSYRSTRSLSKKIVVKMEFVLKIGGSL